MLLACQILFLDFWHNSSHLDCPKILIINLTNYAWEINSGFAGKYFKGESYLDQRNYWITERNERAIWYFQGRWVVGSMDGLGTGVFGISSTVNDLDADCPTNINDIWEVYNGSAMIKTTDMKVRGKFLGNQILIYRYKHIPLILL